MSAEHEPEEPVFVRRPPEPGVRVIDGVRVRHVESLPEPDVRDRVAWTFVALPSLLD